MNDKTSCNFNHSQPKWKVFGGNKVFPVPGLSCAIVDELDTEAWYVEVDGYEVIGQYKLKLIEIHVR